MLAGKLKREYRGAVRELRRDNRFLAKQKMIETRNKDKQRQQKTKRLMATLMGQQADSNKLARQKKKMKK